MDAPVVIVGSGPSGLVLAAELRLGGVDVIVLDMLGKPTGESRGLGFTARTMEMFDQRGLLPRFGAVETSALGHFGGTPLDFSVLEGAHLGARGIPQARTEAVLGEWAAELGADVRRGWQAVRLTDNGDGVDLDVEGPQGRRRLRGRYVVGCDGGRSTVRRAAGFDFPGTDSTIEMFLADVAGCDLPARQIGEKRPVGWSCPPPGRRRRPHHRVRARHPARRRTEPPGLAGLRGRDPAQVPGEDPARPLLHPRGGRRPGGLPGHRHRRLDHRAGDQRLRRPRQLLRSGSR
jgi:bifunctional hydroxylase/dehydrase